MFERIKNSSSLKVIFLYAIAGAGALTFVGAGTGTIRAIYSKGSLSDAQTELENAISNGDQKSTEKWEQIRAEREYSPTEMILYTSAAAGLAGLIGGLGIGFATSASRKLDKEYDAFYKARIDAQKATLSENNTAEEASKQKAEQQATKNQTATTQTAEKEQTDSTATVNQTVVNQAKPA